MDKLEQKEMQKIRPIKNTYLDWLFSYIPQPIRKGVAGLKDKFMSLFNTNTPKKQCIEEERN